MKHCYSSDAVYAYKETEEIKAKLMTTSSSLDSNSVPSDYSNILMGVLW